MKNLIYLILIVLMCVVGYMYFFGKGEDRERAEKVVSETKDLGKSVADFIKRQKDKYDEGEFDRLLDKIGQTLEDLKSSKGNDEEVTQNLRDLESELKKIEPEKLSDENKERLKKMLNEVERELDET